MVSLLSLPQKKVPLYLISTFRTPDPTTASLLLFSISLSLLIIIPAIIGAMGPRTRSRRRHHVSSVQPLMPLMEDPDPEAHDAQGAKKERRWQLIKAWLRLPIDRGISGNHLSMDLRLVLGVLGCPLAPMPVATSHPSLHFSIKDSPIETSSARYILQQYLAASGCLKQRKGGGVKSMYVAGSVKMLCHETDGALWRSGARGGGERGCFVLWQKSPGKWLVELVAAEHKVAAGSDGEVVWRNLPWLGTNAARGPLRPLRRIVQGLDPKTTASMFCRAQCVGEKFVMDDNCFVLKVSADRATVAERSEGPAEVIRHVLYAYFSQRSGLLVYLEDSHLTRVQAPGSDAIYWETTIASVMEDYREVDGVAVAHQGSTVATVMRFGEAPACNSRVRMEEAWRIEDVVFNVPGLSDDYFIPPKDIMAGFGNK